MVFLREILIGLSLEIFIYSWQKFVYQKVIAIASTLFKPVIMIPLLFMGYKSVTMCVVITIINTFVLLSNYFYCKRKLKINIEFNGFDKKIFRGY